MAPPKKRNRANENFTKRWRTFSINGLRMHRMFDADVCILVRRHGRYYWFRSTPTLKIPYEEEVMQSYPLPIVMTAADAERLERRRQRQDVTPDNGQRTSGDA